MKEEKLVDKHEQLELLAKVYADRYGGNYEWHMEYLKEMDRLYKPIPEYDMYDPDHYWV
jgi:hypothetical protein